MNAPNPPQPSVLEERVLAWLRGEGYPLEFRTARVLRDCGFHVQQGRHFRSRDDTPREIDVVADLNLEEAGTLLRVSHFIECKWSRDHPWVVFSSSHSRMTPSACVAQTLGNDLASAILWCLAGDTPLHSMSVFAAPRRPGFGGRQAFTKGKDQVYSAMQAIVDATQAEVSRSTLVQDGLDGELEYAQVGLPTIVVDGDLFEAFWDESTQEMTVERREHVRVHWQGAAAWQMHASVDLVTSAGLEEFMQRRSAEIARLLPRMGEIVREIRVCRSRRSLDPLTITSGGRGYTGRPPFLRRLQDEITPRLGNS